MAQQLPDPEFPDNIAIRAWCNQVRRQIHTESMALGIAAVELQAALGQVDGRTGLFGIDSKIRARIVASHLNHAAEAQKQAAAAVVRAYMSFRKHFGAELDAANGRKPRKPTFVFKPDEG